MTPDDIKAGRELISATNSLYMRVDSLARRMAIMRESCAAHSLRVAMGYLSMAEAEIDFFLNMESKGNGSDPKTDQRNKVV